MKPEYGDFFSGRGSLNWFASWWTAWTAFWFTPSNPFLLSVLRIFVGSLLAWSNFVWLLDQEGFFGLSGWQSAGNVWRLNDQPWHWSWYFPAQTLLATKSLTAVSLLASISLSVGLLTRPAACIAFAGYVSAVNRAPLNTFGFDDVLGIMLVPLIIGTAGARLSVDSIVWKKQSVPNTETTIALRLIQVHLCILYFFSGCGKLLGASWWEGTAIWGAVANIQYRTIDLTFLAWHPLLINALTLGTLFWEVSYSALIWPRLTRPLVLAMAVFVHLGIGLTMGMMEFGIAMLIANMAFLPLDPDTLQTHTD
ncbi:MAG TPA: HTTM domain-containing protein [Planctomycetaceae bacterium]|nr:HTTM domain-containing protein [Planctomycetaceae bacterium]